ncbi:ubiquinone biosynthesis protein COQ7 [Legionella beliardensis]|uniref:3-demethoxyubiquinol 3-hydroxylase n=1 Tax=Legionella beliardensis TaxID=91822 RepID=A0A378I4M2_9GAMM|nr:2-polyprenyl-3-methyl-6-methoxy-1,4-benzoquinone monooxygenase [Legionella beliardensis]STX30139.1 ubiquinone biosynthesis protein COQ7 [Legionella beliardensis]
MKQFSILDQIINEIDVALRAIIPPQQRVSKRPSPADKINTTHLTTNQKKHVAGLMRVNHSGEVCAQALYQGQALTARLTHVKKQMANAALEEIDHLSWCEQRLYELNSQPSLLNPLWYIGSFTIGAFAGLIGDQFSLGFLAETETQVSAHLQKHLQKLPPEDKKTELILKQMQEDEAQHAEAAKQAGAMELPRALKNLMNTTSKIMTKTSYYI